ncbi:hypothetical protein LZ30DRAFT_774828 [Colletotrichum cereale]|nr:hypothetical protein LZ30DRAFT_774828 [Colletotrichum cereale]
MYRPKHRSLLHVLALLLDAAFSPPLLVSVSLGQVACLTACLSSPAATLARSTSGDEASSSGHHVARNMSDGLVPADKHYSIWHLGDDLILGIGIAEIDVGRRAESEHLANLRPPRKRTLHRVRMGGRVVTNRSAGFLGRLRMCGHPFRTLSAVNISTTGALGALLWVPTGRSTPGCGLRGSLATQLMPWRVLSLRPRVSSTLRPTTTTVKMRACMARGVDAWLVKECILSVEQTFCAGAE